MKHLNDIIETNFEPKTAPQLQSLIHLLLRTLHNSQAQWRVGTRDFANCAIPHLG